jgi:hypothetical protein
LGWRWHSRLTVLCAPRKAFWFGVWTTRGPSVDLSWHGLQNFEHGLYCSPLLVVKVVYLRNLREGFDPVLTWGRDRQN